LKGDIGYGLFGISDTALRKMYEIKGRVLSNPCIVIANMEILDDITLIPTLHIRQWIAAMSAWTTLAVVLPVNPNSKTLSRLSPWVYNKTVTKGTIAAFLNPGDFLSQVIGEAYREEVLFIGSSANPSSQGNIYNFKDLPRKILENVDFYIDHGKSKYENAERKATTIVNFCNWTVKRRGVNAEAIEKSFLECKSISEIS